ncbi:MAG: radical SAM protein [Candidatus Omnitrophica bacterium]|nr:radical SAM protein [Candidatus Omnitrophota bacterium]
MDITLINPAQFSSPTQVTDGVTPPLGLLYISSILKKNNFRVHLIDGLGENPGQYYKYKGSAYRGLRPSELIEKIHPATRVIGISCLFSIAHAFVMDLCRSIKERLPKAVLVLGGAHASALPEYMLMSGCVDFVCVGEAEITFLKLCRALAGNQWEVDLSDLKDIPGLCFKHGSGLIINKDIELLQDVDSLPYPDWDAVPMNNYFRFREPHGCTRSDKWTVMLFSRGCPYDCSFCTTPGIWRRKWRPRDPKKVVEEIIFLQKKYGIEEVHFEDENMNTEPGRLLAFCDELIRQGVKINWQPANGIRPHRMNAEIISRMVEAGCTNIILAPESGSKRVLDEIIGKSLDLEEIIKVARIANRAKIKTSVYFIMGFPGEKKGDIFKTLGLMMRLAKNGVDECVAGLFAPLPGAKLFDKLRKAGKIKVDEAFFASLISMGDIGKARSWSEDIADWELKVYQISGYLLFHGVKAAFHPVKTGRVVLNVLSGRQELKTERFILSKFRKIKILNRLMQRA